MGEGIYGCNQGNENREAGRHNGGIIVAERIAEEVSSSVGNGRELEHMRSCYQLGAMDSLAAYAAMLVKEWGDNYLPLERKAGESQKKYNERSEKFASNHYHRVVQKVQGLISMATCGGSAMLRSDGVSLKSGDKITIPGRPLVSYKKADWRLPVGEFKAPVEG